MVVELGGQVIACVVGEAEEGAALVSRAINLDPNLAFARHSAGMEHLWRGDLDAALEHFQVGLRLSPLDPRAFLHPAGIAFVHFLAGLYDETFPCRTHAGWPERGHTGMSTPRRPPAPGDHLSPGCQQGPAILSYGCCTSRTRKKPRSIISPHPVPPRSPARRRRPRGASGPSQ